MKVTPGHPIYVENEGWLLAENLELGARLRRADGGMAKVLAIERLELDEPQPVYNFTVKGPHTYFVLDAGVLVHNSSCPQWVDDILRQRRIDKPEGLELNTHALAGLRDEIDARLSRISDVADKNAALRSFNQAVTAILEVDGCWYLGLNPELDRVIASNTVGGVVPTKDRIGGYPRLYPSHDHAETHAIREYWDDIGRQPRPAQGVMVVSRQPCRTWVFGR